MSLIQSLYSSFGVAPMQVLGMPLTALTMVIMGFHRAFQYFLSYPMIYALVNTTSVFLNNTQEVWKPLYDTSLSLIKPLAIFKPVSDVGLVVVELTARSFIILGYISVLTLREVGKYTLQIVNKTREAGVSLSTIVENTYVAAKDFTGAIFSVARGFSYLTVNIVKAAGYVVNSFELVSNFLSQSVFAPNTISWADVYNISLPFAIVATILTYVFWRSYNVLFKPYMTKTQTQTQTQAQPTLHSGEGEAVNQNDYSVLRRSSRIARKRALLLSHDLHPFPSVKTSSFTPTMAWGGQRTPNL